ncbi:MAG: VOC family protein, partial [Planctomycetaceae bacterium]|nr:VOC family protein [Planctomycetaceae bacterium]
MSQESAVEFPGNFRVHIALTVSNLEQSKQFYNVLLGVSPIKERPRYAKYEPQDPSVNLTLNETDEAVQVEGGSAHFGIQV